MNPRASPTLVLLVGAATVALVWKFVQLRRAPWDRALWIVILALVWLLASVGIGAWQPQLIGAIGWLPTLMLLTAAGPLFALLVLIFFYFADRQNQAEAVKMARWQLVPAAAVYLAQILALTHLPPGVPFGSFAAARVDVPQIAGYYISENAYLAYAVGWAAFLAARFARRADHRTRWGLWIAAIGLALCSLVGLGRIASVVLRIGRLDTATFDAVNVKILAAGMFCFFLGVTYPGVVARWAALRRWNWHRRTYPRLEPLWTSLSETFPDQALSRYRDVQVRAPWSRVSRRSSRRIVECRDGLVRIGPHLRELGLVDGEDDPHRVASALRGAMRERATGREVSGAALQVMPPTGDALDDDVAQLVALSDAMISEPGVPVGATAGDPG